MNSSPDTKTPAGQTKPTTSKKRGAKTKLKPEVKEIFKRGIELGLSYKDCCEKAGISFETFNQWRKGISEFSDLVRTANITMKENCLKSLNVGMLKDWKAGAWKLERRFPDEYKERKEVEVTDEKRVINDLIDTEDEPTKPIKTVGHKPDKPDKPQPEAETVFETA